MKLLEDDDSCDSAVRNRRPDGELKVQMNYRSMKNRAIRKTLENLIQQIIGDCLREKVRPLVKILVGLFLGQKCQRALTVKYCDMQQSRSLIFG